MLRVWAVVLLSLGAVSAQNTFPLESVELQGTALAREVVLDIAELKLGVPINVAAMNSACAKLSESGLFTSVEYRYKAGPKRGYALTLVLEDQTKLRGASIDIHGVDEDEAWGWLMTRFPRFNHKLPDTGAALQFVEHQLEKRFAAQLHGQRIVDVMEQDLNTGRSFMSLQPETLPQVGTLTFTGNQALTTERLLAIVAKPLNGLTYLPRTFRYTVDVNLRRAYEELGLYRVKFPQMTGTLNAQGRMDVAITVEEGAPYTLGSVELVGENLPSAAMLKAGNLKSGVLANWTKIEMAMREMERPLRRTGYFEERANAERVYHDDTHVLDLKVHFRNGPLFHVGRVRINGLPPNLESEVLVLWRAKPGTVFDYEYADEFVHEFARSRLVETLRLPKITFVRGDEPATMDFVLTFPQR